MVELILRLLRCCRVIHRRLVALAPATFGRAVGRLPDVDVNAVTGSNCSPERHCLCWCGVSALYLLLPSFKRFSRYKTWRTTLVHGNPSRGRTAGRCVTAPRDGGVYTGMLPQPVSLQCATFTKRAFVARVRILRTRLNVLSPYVPSDTRVLCLPSPALRVGTCLLPLSPGTAGSGWVCRDAGLMLSRI